MGGGESDNGHAMAEPVKQDDGPVSRAIARAWRALASPGPAHKPVGRTGAPQIGDIHPPGSCARTAQPPDFSDLFAPDTPEPEDRRR